jgi:transcriptional regulator with XRE-family HTH domain
MVLMGTAKADKRSPADRKAARPLPHPAERAIAQLGADFSRARRRRSITQENLAQRAGVSLSTVKRLEAGDPRMQLHVLARVLLVFGDLDKLKVLLDSAGDDIGLALADEGLPQRVRARKGQNAF